MNSTQLLLIGYLFIIPFICALLGYAISKWILKKTEHKTFINRGIIIGFIIDILFIIALFYAIKKMT